MEKRYPDLFVVGGQKCGTTTLYALLRLHPELFLADLKETHHFTLGGAPPQFTDSAAARLNQTAVWRAENYCKLFAPAGARLAVEVCPSYLYDMHAAQHIHAANPHARIVIVLRQPAERSFSAYRHMKARGAETASSFAAALMCEADHVTAGWQGMAHYIRASCYAPQVARYYEWFGPDRVMILQFDEVVADPVAAANRIAHFASMPPLPLGVKAAQTNPTQMVNNSLARALLVQQRFGVHFLRKIVPQRIRGKLREQLLKAFAQVPETLPPDMREALTKDFEQDIQALERLTGQDFGDWRR